MIKCINPLNHTRWDAFVENHPYASVYHHSSWMKVIAITYRHVTPLCFLVEDKDYNIHSAIPCFIVTSKVTGTRMVSLPFTSYCDPLVHEQGDFILLFDTVVDKFNKISASYLEFRVLKKTDLFKDERLKIHNYYKTHILNLKAGFEEIKRQFPRDILYSRRRALKSGVTVRQYSCEQDLKDFYLIHAKTRKRQGFPVQPYAFFKNMVEIMHPQGHFVLLVGELDRRVIAGMVLFKFNNLISFEIGASDPKYLAVRPNHLLIWTAIEMACSEGYHYFDFGKSPPENKGLIEFKTRWGAHALDVPYFYYPEIKGLMSMEQSTWKHRMLMSLNSHMPLSLAKVIGRIAYCHLG
ncbi:MAG: lipid II:glycine glycyltransferase FemX [Candidatus Hodarchaeota archaeon]